MPVIRDSQVRYGSQTLTISGAPYVAESLTISAQTDVTDIENEVGLVTSAIYRTKPYELSTTLQFANDSVATPAPGWLMSLTTGIYPTGVFLITSTSNAIVNKDIAKLSLTARQKLAA